MRHLVVVGQGLDSGNKLKGRSSRLWVSRWDLLCCSNRAREERALAAEKRLSALSQKPMVKGKLSPDSYAST
jgi:hypothetical protein